MSRKAIYVALSGLVLSVVAPVSLQAQRVLPGASAAETGPVIALVPAGRLKDMYMVDVYAQGAADLRSYQVTVDVAGGRAGKLELAGVVINRQRVDYVFGQAEVVTAESVVEAKLGAVAYDRGVQVSDWAYLGTYLFRPTKDAAGDFTVSIRRDSDTLLADTKHQEMSFVAGPAARLKLDSRDSSSIRSAATSK